MHKNMSSSKRKRKRSEKFALLCGDDEIARGTESEMKRRKRRQRDYSTAEKPIRVVPVSSLKRSREDTIDLTTELYEDTKRLRLEQDDEFARGLAEDQRREREKKALAKEKEREKKALAEWYERYKKPENVAVLYEELFQKKFSLKLHC